MQTIHTANEAHDKSIALMKFLSKLATRLGVAKHVYVVGGAVRDFVLDRPIKDVDVVIDSVALGKDSDWFAKQVVRAIPASVSMTTNNYGVALLNVTGPWVLDGLDMRGEQIEIANARKESYGGEAGKGYKPHLVEPSTIQEDVERRELTYNCMVGDTLIPTEKGLLRIDQIASRELGDQQKVHLRVSGKEGAATAVGWQYSGHTRTVKVTSEWGHQFSCTGHHPVLVLQNNEHVWMRAENLSPGDLLCVPSESLTRTDPLPLDLSDPVRPVRGWLKEVRKPQQMTPDLAFLMGCIISEGSNTHKRVSFSNSDPALISRYEESFEKVFGFRPSRNQIASVGDVRVFHGTSYTVSRDGFDVYADSKTLVGWLDELGLYMGGRQNGKTASHFKVVPWSILQADRQSQAAFLAAYLEGDGSIDPESGRITYISNSPILRRQLQALLGSHGVLSQVQRRFVLINAVDSAKLWSEIEPFMVSKRFDYENRTFKSRNRFGIPKDYLSRFLKSRMLRSVGREGVAYQTDDGGEVVLQGVQETLRTIKRLLHDAHARGEFDSFLGSLERISPVEAQKLKYLFRCSYQYVPVAFVEEDGEQDVYDISMHESVEPAFIANGVVVHNTLLIRLLDLANGPDKKDIIDLTGCGIRDLQEGRMQCPAPPDKVFSDDPSRMIRVIKFALRYGHKLTPDTKAAIIRNADKLKKVPSSHLAQMLTQIILTESTWKPALVMMDDLGLLEPVREIVLSDKSFRSTMEGYLKRQKMDMLFGLMDVGLPLGAQVNFLSGPEQMRLREIALGMDRDEAWEFLGMVKNPGNAYKDKQFALDLAEEHGVRGKDLGPFMQRIMVAGRDLLLRDPDLVSDPVRLKALITQRLSGSGSFRQADTFRHEWYSMRKGDPVGSWKSLIPMCEMALINPNGSIFRQHLYYLTGKRSLSQLDDEGVEAVAEWVRSRYHRGDRPMMHAASERYEGIDFKPPEAVANAAARGLEYRQKASPSNRGGLTPAEAAKEGIGSGVQRAVNLKNRDTVSPETIKKMVGFFSRHEKNKSVAAEHKNEPWNDKGYVSWLLWGGGPGKSWSEKIMQQMARVDQTPKQAKKLDAVWVVTDPTPDSEIIDIVWKGDPGMVGRVARGSLNWDREHPAFHDELGSALQDANQRLQKLWKGEIPDWVMQDKRQLRASATRVAQRALEQHRLAATDGKVTGNGTSVGLFIPIPEPLASLYPAKEEDKSPAHTTFLFVGEVPKDREAEFIDALTMVLGNEPGPIQAWTNGVDSFVHPDKNRTVFYTPIRFSRDMGEVRDRVWVALEEAGFEVKHSFPMAFFPHSTLAYVEGTYHEHGYNGEVPDGAWTFDSIQVWGLSKLYDIPLGTFEVGFSEFTDTIRRYSPEED